MSLPLPCPDTTRHRFGCHSETQYFQGLWCDIKTTVSAVARIQSKFSISPFLLDVLYMRRASAFSLAALLHKHCYGFNMKREHQVDVWYVFFVLSVLGNSSIVVFMGVFCSREQVNGFYPFGRTSRYMGFNSCHLRWQRH